MNKKKKQKNKKLSPEVIHVNSLIENTKRNIKGDDSELDKLFIGQLERLNKRLKSIS